MVAKLRVKERNCEDHDKWSQNAQRRAGATDWELTKGKTKGKTKGSDKKSCKLVEIKGLNLTLTPKISKPHFKHQTNPYVRKSINIDFLRKYKVRFNSGNPIMCDRKKLGYLISSIN